MNIQSTIWLVLGLGLSLPSLAFAPSQNRPIQADNDPKTAPYIVFGAIEATQDREAPDTTVRLFSRSQPQTEFCWQAGRLNPEPTTVSVEEVFTTPKGGQILHKGTHISQSNADGTRHSITSLLTLSDDPNATYRSCWVWSEEQDPIGIYQLTVTIGTKPPITRSVTFELAH